MIIREILMPIYFRHSPHFCVNRNKVRVRQRLLANVALRVVRSNLCRVTPSGKATPLSSVHAHVQKGRATVREYPYPALGRKYGILIGVNSTIFYILGISTLQKK